MEENIRMQDTQEKEIKEQMYEYDTVQQKKSPKKGLITFGIILLCLILFITYIVYQHKKKYPGVRTDFASIEEFEECKGYVPKEIPEGASDVRFYLNRTLLKYESIYSFVISDEEEFDAFMESRIQTICAVPEGVTQIPYWDRYSDGVYTDEELEEMAYLEEHYSEMDYKEILSMADHRYGFFYGYGAKVSDYYNMEYSLAKFPMKDSFSYVIDENLDDYIILGYDEFDGSKDGTIVDPESHRVVVFKYVTW